MYYKHHVLTIQCVVHTVYSIQLIQNTFQCTQHPPSIEHNQKKGQIVNRVILL